MNEKKSTLILHIDDEESIRLSIQGFLEDFDYEVVTAENGKIGLEKFRELNPDLVLVDLRMPEVDGLDVLAEICESSPETPIIVISGTGVIADVIEALRLGAWNYILKPIQNMSVLLHAVESALERAFLMRDNKDYQENLEQKIFEQTEELHKKNMELKNSEEYFRSIIENSNDIVLIIDSSGKIVYESPSHMRILGYPPGELIGKNTFDNVHPEDKKHIQMLFDNMKEKVGQVENITLKYQHFDGSWRFLEGTATNLLQLSSVKGIVLNYRDITERESLQKQLNQAQKMESIGTLAGGIAHDFNNLLTVINGFSDFILMNLKDNDPFYKEVSSISSAGKKATNLTRQILAFSRKQIFQPKIISINDVISDLDKMIHRLIGEDINIDVNLIPDLPNIKADPGQIEQILINLIVNARDAINQKTEKASEKKISIETEKVCLDEFYVAKHVDSKIGLHICLSVCDNGIGMTNKHTEKIFEPFFTSKEKGKGTGLGLSTVYGIVKQNKGSIYVSSEPGVGSKFKIFWPVSDKKLTYEASRDEIKSELHGNEKILLVEDDEEVRNMAFTALKDFGYLVYTANNGIDALNLIKNKKIKIDLLFTDMVMPDMNGKELSVKLKEIFPDVIVLFASGYADNHVVQSGELDKNINFLQKPYSIKILLKKIREILENR
jgi:PAS domain S-box-containing protein